MSARHFLDTNVLLYSISRDAQEARKREQAITLLDGDGAAGLSVQVLQEFYVQATRTTRRDALPHLIAASLIRTWMRFEVQDITISLLTLALEIKAHHELSYWDSAVVAAARMLGCGVLYSEDMTHGREIEGVLIANPFR